MMRLQAHHLWLAGAVLVGLCARTPGIFWGANFPTGWFGHHVDEYTHLVNAERLINPTLPPRWPPHPYPNGMAAHAAAPLVLWRALDGNVLGPLPSPQVIITTGRVVAVLYGAATIVVLFLLVRRLTANVRVAVLAAWFLALGGLHVSQSHYFLSDVPALFWLLLGLYLLLRETQAQAHHDALLYAAALCLGAAFGLKLLVYGMPSLLLVALLRRPRLIRLFFSAVAFIAGIAIITLGSYTSYELVKTLVKGVSDPYEFTIASNVLLYLIELPSIVSLPFAGLALAGVWLMSRAYARLKDWSRAVQIAVVWVLPFLVTAGFIVFHLDHFPRHLVMLVPWLAVSAAWALTAASDRIGRETLLGKASIAAVFLYLGLFVYDGERVFLQEPRNEAARWVLTHFPRGSTFYWTHHNWFPGYRWVEYPQQGRPDFIVAEMHTANHYLSGMSWRNSYPRDYRKIFDSRSQQRVDQLQALFLGRTEYTVAARFSEGYFMPEYRWVDRLIGNRSRNYVAEIVIFHKRPAVEGRVRIDSRP